MHAVVLCCGVRPGTRGKEHVMTTNCGEQQGWRRPPLEWSSVASFHKASFSLRARASGHGTKPALSQQDTRNYRRLAEDAHLGPAGGLTSPILSLPFRFSWVCLPWEDAFLLLQPWQSLLAVLLCQLAGAANGQRQLPCSWDAMLTGVTTAGTEGCLSRCFP